jgi:hypothetical protein
VHDCVRTTATAVLGEGRPLLCSLSCAPPRGIRAPPGLLLARVGDLRITGTPSPCRWLGSNRPFIRPMNYEQFDELALPLVDLISVHALASGEFGHALLLSDSFKRDLCLERGRVFGAVFFMATVPLRRGAGSKYHLTHWSENRGPLQCPDPRTTPPTHPPPHAAPRVRLK